MRRVNVEALYRGELDAARVAQMREAHHVAEEAVAKALWISQSKVHAICTEIRSLRRADRRSRQLPADEGVRVRTLDGDRPASEARTIDGMNCLLASPGPYLKQATSNTGVAVMGVESNGTSLAAPEPNVGLSAQGFVAVDSAIAYLRVEKRDALQLLGGVSEATYDACATEGLSILDGDTLGCMSHVVGLVGALRALFVDDEAGRAWLHGRNTDPPFYGQSPLAYAVDGPVHRLRDVQRYLEGWLQG